MSTPPKPTNESFSLVDTVSTKLLEDEPKNPKTDTRAKLAKDAKIPERKVKKEDSESENPYVLDASSNTYEDESKKSNPRTRPVTRPTRPRV